MKSRTLVFAVLALVVLGASSYGAFRYGQQSGMPAASSGATLAAAAAGRKILYWHDPMVPSQKFDKPGKSPFMDMQLVPVYADAAGDKGDSGGVAVSARVQQSLGVRTGEVVEGALATQVAAVGSIAWNERDQVVVQARAAGFIERLHVRATLDRVAKGQVLAELYVPDWVAAQEEFLAVRAMKGGDLGSNLGGNTAPLVDAARQRMRLAGMSDEQIAKVEAAGKVQARLSIVAPAGGVVTELAAREGMTVAMGAPLFRIAGLSTVWANAEVPESQAGTLRAGTRVEASSPALPGSVFKGTVQAILPEVNQTTRTLKARVELSNAGGKLVPGMFVSMRFADAASARVLLVPSEAVIQTGRRAVVILAEDKGRFRPVDVETGVESGGQTEIRSGLTAGQRVVISSQFLIDSEASLRGVLARMVEAPGPAPASAAVPAAQVHHGSGVVVSVNETGALIKHGNIPSAGMGPMTMEYAAPKSGMPKTVKAGDSVHFEFTMNKDFESVLTAITAMPAGAAAATPAAKGGKP
jgi:Cu(I)/Ag(I) efflux system membrane fusion protein